MKVWATVQHGLGVFRHFVVEHFDGGIMCERNGVKITRSQAAATAHAIIVIDRGFLGFGGVVQGVIGALLDAGLAANAQRFVDIGLTVAVLLRFTSARSATHANIFDGAAKAGHLMPLKVGEADENIGIHNGAANLGFLDIFTAHHGHQGFVCAFEPVANDDGAIHRKGRKTVLPCAFQMFQGIFAATGIHGIAVGQERLTAKILDRINNRTRIVGAQVTDVAKLPKMQFDGNKTALHINVADASFFDHFLQLGGQTIAKSLGAKIRKIHLCFFHKYSPSRLAVLAVVLAVMIALHNCAQVKKGGTWHSIAPCCFSPSCLHGFQWKNTACGRELPRAGTP